MTHNGKFEPLKYKRNFQGDFANIDIKKYKKIYLLDIHVLLDDNSRKMIEDNFHKVNQDEKSTVQTYVRN